MPERFEQPFSDLSPAFLGPVGDLVVTLVRALSPSAAQCCSCFSAARGCCSDGQTTSSEIGDGLSLKCWIIQASDAPVGFDEHASTCFEGFVTAAMSFSGAPSVVSAVMAMSFCPIGIGQPKGCKWLDADPSGRCPMGPGSRATRRA